ncbi:hypothetical protein C8F04DRAFT_1104407 [Mycena alexandri]|uniref:Uncharacterized protein n=1 Tax=Mycena alexandri TaxID=1745969 RepID=A0AAD6X655_9AGAR|nr:hypothetical protein C8F04DRAFT_1104407 [Mycena alexandri]
MVNMSSTSSTGDGDSEYLLAPPPQYELTPATTGTFPPPIPGNKPTLPAPTAGPARLHILGATWGGIIVTPDIQSLVSATQTLTLDMRSLVHVLSPDPLPNCVKTLSVLYQYAGAPEGMCLLSTSELDPSASIWPGGHQRYRPPMPAEWQSQPSPSICALGSTWRGQDGTGVEILAVLWGGQKIETPSVLAELARFFDGLRGQIRMTNNFFKCDPWYNNKKTWAVYFRFAGSERVQVVTGVEDGALEVPWSRR